MITINGKLLLLPTLAAAWLIAFTLPDASAVQYTISGGSVSGNTVDPGLVVGTQLSSDLAKTFSLTDGQSTTFDFFKIWTNEKSVESDDKKQKYFSASLDFSDPFSTAGLGGMTFGGSTWYGVDSGKLIWTSGPAIVTVGGLTYSVALSDVTFNTGFLGLSEGAKHGATVKATVKQISVPSVPDDGSTAMLLGLAFLAIAFVRRRSVTAWKPGS